MAYISQHAVNHSIETITNAAVTLFGDESIQREVEQQRDVFEGSKDITNVLNKEQLKAKEKGEPFKPNMDRANDHGIYSIRWGISTRLQGAYACYKAGDELECIRYLLIALGSICHALNWGKAETYLNEQNRILFAMKKAEEAV